MAVNFRVGKSVLQSLLNKVGPVVPTSVALPILQCTRWIGNPYNLTVIATKLDNSIKAYSENIQTLDEFDLVFPFKRIKEIVSKADNGDIDISVVDSVATLVSGAVSWQIQLPSGETFPELPNLLSGVEIDGGAFKDSFNLVRKAASMDVTRPSLRMVHVANGKLTACDGIKFTQVNLGEDFPVSLSVDIPSASGDLVMHTLKDVDMLRVGSSDTHILLSANKCSLIISKPTSTYPNVEQIMLRPALENKTILKFDKNDLLKAIARVRINANPETEAIGLAVAPKSITVSAQDMTGNGASETIPASWPSKDRLLIVNYNLMLQLLTVTMQDECSLYLAEDTKSRKSAVLLKDDNGTLGLIPQMSGNIQVF